MQRVHTAGPRRASHSDEREPVACKHHKNQSAESQDYIQAFKFLPQCYFLLHDDILKRLPRAEYSTMHFTEKEASVILI